MDFVIFYQFWESGFRLSAYDINKNKTCVHQLNVALKKLIQEGREISGLQASTSNIWRF